MKEIEEDTMFRNSFVHILTKILVDIMFYGGIVCCLAVPLVLRSSLLPLHEYGEGRYYLFYCIILIIAGSCCVYILWQLKIIFRSLSGGNPFVSENVSCLRKSGVASFLIALVFMIETLRFLLISAFFLVIIFALLGLFCLTLKDVFKQAIAYKEENDWTV